MSWPKVTYGYTMVVPCQERIQLGFKPLPSTGVVYWRLLEITSGLLEITGDYWGLLGMYSLSLDATLYCVDSAHEHCIAISSDL